MHTFHQEPVSDHERQARYFSTGMERAPQKSFGNHKPLGPKNEDGGRFVDITAPKIEDGRRSSILGFEEHRWGVSSTFRFLRSKMGAFFVLWARKIEEPTTTEEPSDLRGTSYLRGTSLFRRTRSSKNLSHLRRIPPSSIFGSEEQITPSPTISEAEERKVHIFSLRFSAPNIVVEPPISDVRPRRMIRRSDRRQVGGRKTTSSKMGVLRR